jgi:Cellulase (glycosyl hydrolase family 5)
MKYGYNLKKLMLSIILISILVASMTLGTILNNALSFTQTMVYAQKQQQQTSVGGAQNSKPFVGVNMRGYYTSSIVQNRDFGLTPFPKNYYEDSFRTISQAGMNLVRYLVYWEAYEKNPTLFMNELDTVAKTADKWGLKLIYDNDQYHTSSWLEPDRGYGFPSLLFEDNPKYDFGGGGGFETKGGETAQVWWTDWWNRSVKDANGVDGWTLQADFLKKIVNAVDKHPSTLGYEILNEPQVYTSDQWVKIGSYNTFITNELRKVASPQKIIVFDRQVPPDIYGPLDASPENMAKMAPSNKANVIFKATLFGIPFQGSQPEERLTAYTKAAQIAGVPLCMCEFSLRLSEQYRPASSLNQTLVNLFVQKFNEAKVWGWAVWIWDFKPHSDASIQSYNLVTFKPDKMQTTQNFDYIKNALTNSVANAKQSLGTTQKTADTISPLVSITDVNIIKDKSGNSKKIFQVQGHAIDLGTGIKTVEVKLTGGSYIAAIARPPSDWSNWSVSLSGTKAITTGESYNITAKAVDIAGHENYSVKTLKSR